MTDLIGRTVYVLDTLSYDARGGTGDVYATLESAMAAAPDVKRWVHANRNDRESWYEACRPGSVADIWEIRAEVIR